MSDLTVLHIFFVSEMGCYTVNKCWGLSQNNVLCYSWQNKILFVFFAATKRYIAWQRQKIGISVCSQIPQKNYMNTKTVSRPIAT